MRNQRHKIFLALAFHLGGLLLFASLVAAAQPDVPSEYQKYFFHFVDNRSFVEKALNLIRVSTQNVGRSFALIAGVSKYPHMSGSASNLTPAAWDVVNLSDYLKSHEFFDEIVVLTEENVTADNLNFFLTQYFPQRLENFPSRASCSHTAVTG